SVLVGTSDIADGGTIDFGSTQAGTPVDRTITVKNVGTADLSVSAITSSMPAGFTLVSNLSTTTLHAGDSVSFVVRFASSTTGSFGGDISFTNSDTDEGTYDLHLQGTVAASSTSGGGGGSVTRIIDDGAAGHFLSGSWRVGTRGREGDVHVATGSSATTATSSWTFNGLSAGQYRVYMSWTGDRGNASNTPVKFYSGTQLLGSGFVNQRVASAGYQADGTNWTQVRVLTISGSTLSVQLTNRANGNVVADAVRIERVTSSAAPHGALVGNDGNGSSAA